MTVSQTDIQELIAEVDQLLWKTDKASPEELIEPAQYQAVLEKVRWCLSNLARQVEVPDLDALSLNPPEQQTAKAIAQAVMAQMNLQREAWLQPMQLELETVRQQRETLRREIHHLETQQRQMSHELLQTVMHRCSEALKQELATVFDRLQGQFNQALSGTQAPNNAPPALQQLDWLEKLRSLEQQADQLFLSLDQTFHQVFNSLEQDVQSYHQSLRHKLGQIHELQNQTLLTPRDRSEALPHQAPAAMSPHAVDSALPWQTSPAHEMPLLQLDQGEPLPALQPLITGEFVEPVEQVLQLDLNSDVSAPSQQHTVSSDQAWEAWDEYLFTYDPGQDVPLSVPDLPRVLTMDLPQPNVNQPPTAQDLLDLEPAADLPREVQQELFANLSDPATVAETELAENSSLPPVTTTVAGTMLFGDPVTDPEAETITAEDLAAALDPDVEAETAEPPGPTLEETIASLDDLLEQVSARMAETMTDSESPEPDPEEGEDAISPGETLLATAEVAAQTSGQLDAVLDAQKMDQLSADLASFEAEAPTQVELESTESEPAASASPNPAPAIPISIPSITEEDTSEPVAPPSSSHETSSSNSSTQPDTDRVTSLETPPPSAVSANANTEAMIAAPTPVATPEPALAVPSTPDSTPQSVTIPEPEAAIVAPSSPHDSASEPAGADAAPPAPESSEQPTQTDAVPNPPPTAIVIEMTSGLSSEAAADPTVELPAQVVLSSLSDLDWEHDSAESITTDDAQGDLWGEQRPSVSIASGQNG